MSNQLSTIEAVLRQLLGQVSGIRLELAAKGKMPKPGDVKTPAFYHKLQTIGERVIVAMRMLKSMEHGQLLRAERLYDLSRDARYRERRSVDDTLANIERVRTFGGKSCLKRA